MKKFLASESAVPSSIVVASLIVALAIMFSGSNSTSAGSGVVAKQQVARPAGCAI